MAIIWINTRKGLKQVTIRKVRNKDEYDYVKKKRKKKVIKKKVIKRRIIKRRQTTRRRIGTPKRPQRISEVFEKKVSKVTIKNFLDIPTNEMNLQYKPLLKQVMNKKSLGDLASDSVLDAMIKQENINKIKWRFEIRSNVYDRDGTTVLQMIKGSGGDLMTLRENMKKGIWRGAYVDYDIDIGDGYIFKSINKGNVDRVEVTIIFRS